MEKKYKCECGKEFQARQNFAGHQRMCAVHHKEKGDYLEWKEGLRETNKKVVKTKREKKLQKWIEEEHRCEKCGKIMKEKFGSGRFCSIHCSQSRVHPKLSQKEKSHKRIISKQTAKEKAQQKREKNIALKYEQIRNFLKENSFEGEEWKEFKASANSNSKTIWHISNFGRVSKNFSLGYGKLHQDGYSYLGNMRAVHRIVAEAFIPKTEEDILLGRTFIDHIDGNKLNNHYTNLRWCTIKENSNFPLARLHLSEASRGEKNPNYGKATFSKGKILYNNGEENHFYEEGKQPSGWVKGRLKFN